ncbi:MAG: HxsD-like protein [Myxococcota bacterium]|nr:HxsD-like protein [Myxococcota bacterium]
MSELRFHRGLYPSNALDEAIAVYESHADITRADDGEHVVVTIASAKPGRDVRVARELANYALGLAIQARGATAPAPSLENR